MAPVTPPPAPAPAPPAPPAPVRYVSVYPTLRIAYGDGYLVFVGGAYTTADPAEIAFLDARESCARAA